MTLKVTTAALVVTDGSPLSLTVGRWIQSPKHHRHDSFNDMRYELEF